MANQHVMRSHFKEEYMQPLQVFALKHVDDVQVRTPFKYQERWHCFQVLYMQKRNTYAGLSKSNIKINQSINQPDFTRVAPNCLATDKPVALRIPNPIGFWKCWCLRRDENQRKPLRERTRTNNKLNPHMTPDLEIKPMPHWLEACLLIAAPSLLPNSQRKLSATLPEEVTLPPQIEEI